MAASGGLFERIARSLEEARAQQQPGDDLRARLGYGTEDDFEDDSESESVWTPDTERGSETDWQEEPDRESGSDWVRETETGTAAESPPRAAWESLAARRRVSAESGTAAPHRAPSPSAAAPSPTHAPSASVLSGRVRERLRAPGGLREAFVLKEILDRPLGRRRGK